MGYNDRLLEKSLTMIEDCPKCGKTFECTYEEQTPGFRMKDEKRCPHCGAILRESMEYEFITRKL